MTKNLSLATKNALSYFFLFFLTISLIGFFLLKSSSDEIINGSKNKLIHSSEIVNLRLNKYLEDLRNDSKQLAKSPLLYNFMLNRNALEREILEKEYQNVLHAKKHISQLRFIGIEEGGKEIIRVERSKNRINITPLDSLQVKGDRDYFKSTVQLPPDSLYVSKIDLNKEYGAISKPYTPTLRLSYPVFLDEKIKGIVVINTDLTGIYKEIVQIVGSENRLSLINDQGFYLLSNDYKEQFEFEFDKSSSFLKEYERVPDSLFTDDQGFLDWQGDHIHILKNCNYPRNDYKVFLIITADKNTLLENYFIWRNKGILIIIGLSLLSLSIAFILLRRQVIDLTSITSKINEFSSSLKLSKLPEHRNDEIGVLASSFNKMSQVINRHVRALNEEKEKAEQAVKEKQEFIENMSHEIRNPIQSILGFSELLSINKHLPHQTALIQSIQSSTVHLQNLTNDILDYKKLIQGNVELRQDYISLIELMEILEKIFSYSAMIKGIDLEFEIDQDLLGKQYLCDRTRLNQILSNLIINAIKYTPDKGKIIVRLDVLEIHNTNEKLRFSVIDNGKGITKEQIHKIKERYFGENLVDSFGLGLSIVNKLLLLHGSSLTINSKPQHGSEFSFELDLESKSNSDSNEKTQSKDSSIAHLKLKCLIIEDDIQIIHYYKMIFENELDELEICDDLDSLKELKDNYYDIALVDYIVGSNSLPKFLDKVLAKLNNTSNLFVISAKQESEIVLDCAYSYIQKPFSKDSLKSRISDKYIDRVYDEPDFSSIYEDYDNDLAKVIQALELLWNEWVKLKDEMIQSIEDDKHIAVGERVHKIITSVRRIKLKDFEDLLIKVQSGDIKLSKELASEIENRMKYYLSCIEDHIRSLGI